MARTQEVETSRAQGGKGEELVERQMEEIVTPGRCDKRVAGAGETSTVFNAVITLLSAAADSIWFVARYATML